MTPAKQSAATSAISRLEAKYSDVLGRRRRDKPQEDREKTLEPPERPYMNPVTRSATTVILGDKALYAYQKDRTPYRVTNRNRNKYADANDSVTSYKQPAKSELSLLHESNRHKSKQSTDYDPIRRKDTLYDAYSKNASNRYPNISSDYKTRNAVQNYYDGHGKENVFKSKYDPDKIYAEINNNGSGGTVIDTFDPVLSAQERERKRQIRSYKRTCTANDRRHTTNYRDLKDDEPSTASAANTSAAASSRYSQRKSYQRSQTQKFFDSENNNNNSQNTNHAESIFNDSAVAAAAAVALVAAAELNPNPILTEREARRKEIQGLIMKYAQLDDVYNKATEDEANNNNCSSAAAIAASGEYRHVNGLLPSASSVSIAPLDKMVPLSKTQSVAAMSSVRSRIPKALSTFVRFENFYRLFICFYRSFVCF